MARRTLVLALFAALWAQGCLGAGGDLRTRKDDASAGKSQPAPSRTGIGFRLADSDAPVGALEERRAVAGEPLGEADAARLLARLPKLVQEAGDAQEFVMPASSKEGPAALEGAGAGPLRVDRFSPGGMVPIGTLANLSHEEVPARITPQSEGSWTWQGTRMLVFEPKKRLPMATAFTVSVPAGTKAANGQAQAEEVRWSFSTPPPTLTDWHPRGEFKARDPAVYRGGRLAFRLTRPLPGAS